MKELKARFKLWLNSEEAEGVFGDGKWRLLQAIEKEGSLRAACKALGISYRKAWGDLKKAEDSLDVCLVERRRGGNTGGGTGLTGEGKEWVRAYGRFRGEVKKAVEGAYTKHMREVAR